MAEIVKIICSQPDQALVEIRAVVLDTLPVNFLTPHGRQSLPDFVIHRGPERTLQPVTGDAFTVCDLARIRFWKHGAKTSDQDDFYLFPLPAESLGRMVGVDTDTNAHAVLGRKFAHYANLPDGNRIDVAPVQPRVLTNEEMQEQQRRSQERQRQAEEEEAKQREIRRRDRQPPVPAA
ncbi:hypothetical protein ASPZODRAFT_895004 [Penicilliopsis zonata CBS 506.65]|uniref:Uncharacterized protein n=1 Tax=Penicilliopsis zonata CBS 506.65 TaxID=1073090 RepID=A0A1L9S8P8_9EURO|nr:hypothetical protein ASPZODRAFT_895004 [Penicilliopsis zonata CBS 506.65]OJJ43536.1 hypothetical protein ASPZODRAFT_895004 [Penicilliopsis zonata CBS 506.65]